MRTFPLLAAAVLVAGAAFAGCAAPEDRRDMGDNSDGLFPGDQPEAGGGSDNETDLYEGAGPSADASG